jgi:hypothetical protein
MDLDARMSARTIARAPPVRTIQFPEMEALLSAVCEGSRCAAAAPRGRASIGAGSAASGGAGSDSPAGAPAATPSSATASVSRAAAGVITGGAAALSSGSGSSGPNWDAHAIGAAARQRISAPVGTPAGWRRHLCSCDAVRERSVISPSWRG